MGRPKIFRIVRNLPGETFYMPTTMPAGSVPIPIENLTIVEFEALRLKHFEKLNQTQCAKKMSISQSTFSRILEKAHEKVTNALVKGNAIHVDGGNYGFKEIFLGYGCMNCLNEWRIELETDLEVENVSEEKLKEILPITADIKCPKCSSDKIYRLKRDIVKPGK